MNLDKWKESSMLTKVGTICVLLSAVFGLILGFILLDSLSEAFSVLPFDVGGALVVFLLVYYGIDIFFFFGLLRLKRWARSWAIWWGILSALSIVLMIKHPSAILISYALSVIAAVCLLLSGADFKKGE